MRARYTHEVIDRLSYPDGTLVFRAAVLDVTAQEVLGIRRAYSPLWVERFGSYAEADEALAAWLETNGYRPRPENP